MKRLTLFGVIVGVFAVGIITPYIHEFASVIGFLVGIVASVVAHAAIPSKP